MKTKTRLLIFLLSFFVANSVHWYEVQNITPVDIKKIEFSVAPEVSFPTDKVSWEIKILRDLEINYSSKDFNDSNKILINLKNELIPNRSYNLLSVFWVDWNIDFTLWDELSLFDIENPENILWIQWISRLLIMDPRNIEVYFNEPIDESEFEFKIFRESLVEDITNTWSWALSINLNDELDKNSKYLFMLISLKDATGIDLTFLEEIYDFSTPIDLWEKKEEPKEEIIEEVVEEIIEEDPILVEEVVEEDPMLVEEVSEETMSWELDDVALNAAITPKSWPETWVLIFLTAIVNIFIFARKKLVK